MIVHWVVGFTIVVSLNPAHDEVYSMQHYVTSVVLSRYSGFRHDITEILLKVGLILHLSLHYLPSDSISMKELTLCQCDVKNISFQTIRLLKCISVM